MVTIIVYKRNNSLQIVSKVIEAQEGQPEYES